MTDSILVPSPSTREATPTEAHFERALESQRAALMAMPEEQIERRARLDPSAVFLVVWAAIERIELLRALLVQWFGAHAIEQLDALSTHALAARQADIEWLKARESTDQSALHDEVVACHRLLITDAESLVNRGFLPAKSLDNARSMLGYQACLDSLQIVTSVLRTNWMHIEPHTPLTLDDLERANDVALRMTNAISKRTQNAAIDQAAELRVRALSKLRRNYEEVRRMVTFVRWFEGGADDITPSLYAGRGPRRLERDDDVPAAPSEASPSDTTAAPIAPGLPGADPFIRQ